MKPQSILNIALLLIAATFCYLYFNERSAAGKWNHLAEKAEAYRKAKEENKVALRKIINTFNLNSVDTSAPFQDDKLAKLYIRHFNDDLANMNKSFTDRGLPAMTSQIWMNAAAVADLAEIISTNNYDGIRLYLSKYPNFKLNPDPQRQASAGDRGKFDEKISLVVVTTRLGANGEHIDTYMNPVTNALEGLYNYHDICPPTCPPKTSTVLGQP